MLHATLVILGAAAILAAAKGQPGLVLLALLLALVVARTSSAYDDDKLDPSRARARLGCVQLAEEEAGTDSAVGAEAGTDSAVGAEAGTDSAAVQPAPAGGLQGYTHESYSADSSRMVAMQIPLYSTKDDPVPDTAWDVPISSAMEEIGKTNLPLPDGQTLKEFVQFRMKDVCNKKNRWMVPVQAPKLHEDAGRPDGRAGAGGTGGGTGGAGTGGAGAGGG